MSTDCTMYDELPEHERQVPNSRQGRVPLSRGLSKASHLVRRGSSFACAVPGINLNDYSKLPSGKGWGAACAGGHTTVTLSNGTRLTVRSEIAELVTLIMNANIRQGYSYRSGDTGAYNCRYISGTTVWSNHAWALAVDSNWSSNPQHTPLITDRPGWEIARWNRYGFAWGGDYTAPTLKDAMHTEFMGTPAQAVAATNLARAELGVAPPPPGPAPVSNVPPKLNWTLAGKYHYGNIGGDTYSLGGSTAAERAFVRNIQQWFIYHGCVPGVPSSSWATSGWADGKWESATDTACITWHNRFYGGQSAPKQVWADDYNRLAAA